MMKYLLPLFLIGSFSSYAGLPPTTMKGQSEASAPTTFQTQVPYNQATTVGSGSRLIETGNGNLLANPSFEASTFSSGWTVLGGVGCNTSSSDVIGGKKSVACSAVGSINDVVSQYVSPSLTTTGRNWEVGIYAAASDVGFSACAVVGGVETQCKTIDVAVNPTYYYFNTPVPNSTAFGIKIKSTTASLKSLKFDEAYVGPARNLVVIPAGGQFVGSIEFGTDCTWALSNNNNFTNYPNDATCTTTVVQGSGSVSVVGATRPAIQVNNTQPGTYQVFFSGNLYKNNANALGCVYRIYDGTSVLGQAANYVAAYAINSGLFGESKYTAPSSSRVFDVQATGDGGAIACDIQGSSPNLRNKLSVYYFPSADQQAVRADQTNFGLTDGGATTLTATTTNPTKGTTSKDKIYYSREGQYLVGRIEYVQTGAGASAGSGDYLWTIPSICTPDTSIVGAYSTVEGQASIFAVRNSIGSGVAADGTNNAILVNTLYDSTKMRLFYLSGAQASTVGLGAVGSGFYGTTAATLSFAFDFKIPCSNFQVNQNSPVIQNSVTSKYAGNKPFLDAYVSNSGTPAFSGIFDGFISSITDNGVGDSTLTFSAAYSAAPRCTCNAVDNVAAPNLSCVLKSVTTTTVRVFTTSAGAAADKDFTILCLGPQ